MKVRCHARHRGVAADCFGHNHAFSPKLVSYIEKVREPNPALRLPERDGAYKTKGLVH